MIYQLQTKSKKYFFFAGHLIRCKEMISALIDSIILIFRLKMPQPQLPLFCPKCPFQTSLHQTKSYWGYVSFVQNDLKLFSVLFVSYIMVHQKLTPKKHVQQGFIDLQFFVIAFGQKISKIYYIEAITSGRFLL